MSSVGAKRHRPESSEDELSEGEIRDSPSSPEIFLPPKKSPSKMSFSTSVPFVPLRGPRSITSWQSAPFVANQQSKEKKKRKKRKRRSRHPEKRPFREESLTFGKRFDSPDSSSSSSSKKTHSSSNLKLFPVRRHASFSYNPEPVSPSLSPLSRPLHLLPPPPPRPPSPPPPLPPEKSRPPGGSSSGKDELVHSMDLVDREITEVEQQIAKLKKKLSNAQEEVESLVEEKAKAKLPVDPSVASAPLDNGGRSELQSQENDELKNHYGEAMQNLVRRIYAENRKTAASAHALCSPLPVNLSPPLYNQPSDLLSYRENMEKAKAFHPLLVAHLRQRRERKLAWKQRMAFEYDKHRIEWERKVQQRENDPKKKAKKLKDRDFYERMFPEIKRQREQQERIQRSQRQLDGFARSEADLKEIIDGLREQELLVEPPDLLDCEERKVQFVSRNGLILDPMAAHKERRKNVQWTEEEKRIFREQFVNCPKDFESISTHLPKKSCGDCIQYYYLSKKKEGYKLMVRKYSQAKRRTKHFQQRPQLSFGLDDKMKEMTERKEQSGISLRHETAKPVATPTYSVPKWSEEEIEAMKEGLREFGKDWLTVSVKIGTKTEHQCRSFFTHYKRKLHLVSYLNEYKAREKALGSKLTIQEEDEDEEKVGPPPLRRASSLQDLLSNEGLNFPTQEPPSVTDMHFNKFINLAVSVVDDYENSRQSTGDATPLPPTTTTSETTDRVDFTGILASEATSQPSVQLPSEVPPPQPVISKPPVEDVTSKEQPVVTSLPAVFNPSPLPKSVLPHVAANTQSLSTSGNVVAWRQLVPTAPITVPPLSFLSSSALRRLPALPPLPLIPIVSTAARPLIVTFPPQGESVTEISKADLPRESLSGEAASGDGKAFESVSRTADKSNGEGESDGKSDELVVKDMEEVPSGGFAVEQVAGEKVFPVEESDGKENEEMSGTGDELGGAASTGESGGSGQAGEKTVGMFELEVEEVTGDEDEARKITEVSPKEEEKNQVAAGKHEDGLVRTEGGEVRDTDDDRVSENALEGGINPATDVHMAPLSEVDSGEGEGSCKPTDSVHMDEDTRTDDEEEPTLVIDENEDVDDTLSSDQSEILGGWNPRERTGTLEEKSSHKTQHDTSVCQGEQQSCHEDSPRALSGSDKEDDFENDDNSEGEGSSLAETVLEESPLKTCKAEAEEDGVNSNECSLFSTEVSVEDSDNEEDFVVEVKDGSSDDAEIERRHLEETESMEIDTGAPAGLPETSHSSDVLEQKVEEQEKSNDGDGDGDGKTSADNLLPSESCLVICDRTSEVSDGSAPSAEGTVPSDFQYEMISSPESIIDLDTGDDQLPSSPTSSLPTESCSQSSAQKPAIHSVRNPAKYMPQIEAISSSEDEG